MRTSCSPSIWIDRKNCYDEEGDSWYKCVIGNIYYPSPSKTAPSIVKILAIIRVTLTSIFSNNHYLGLKDSCTNKVSQALDLPYIR